MGENISIDWFAKFFTYSSIQVKFIATFIAILIFIILRSCLKSSAPQHLSTIKSEQKFSPESEETLKKSIADAKAM